MAANPVFCTNCGIEDERAEAYCPACGTAREIPPKRLAGHIGFVLNELQREPMTSAVDEPTRDALTTHYRDALSALAPRPLAQPVIAPPRPAPAPAPAPVYAPAAPSSRRAVPVAPPVAPSPPYDWSWLAEQQANLFLFAGAFLTVIAALIYVGYSGEAVGGVPKMTLLVVYTLAFLAAGYGCRRIERVATAGNVFFGVGAILVPLNFVAARTIFSEEEVSAESMWLAGSLVSAAFYAGVAWIGLGRMYGIASGAALLSATLAATHVTGMPVEWRPLPLIAVAFAMTLTDLKAPADVRKRIGNTWSPIGQIAAVAAASVAVAMAPLFGIEDVMEGAIRWYLPVTLAAFTLAAGYTASASLRREHGAATVIGFSAAFISVAFALDLRAEAYGVAFALLGLTLMALNAAAARRGAASRLPSQSSDFLHHGALAAAAMGAAIGLSVLGAARDEFDPYIIETRWFVLGIAIPTALMFAVDAFALRTRLGALALPVGVLAVATATLYGFDAPIEWYSIAAVSVALATAAAARFAPESASTYVHSEWRGDVFFVARIGAGAGALLALMIAVAASEETSTIEIAWRWYLPMALALATLVAGLDASRRAVFETTAPFVTGIAATVLACLWSVGVPIEWYSVGLAATGLAAAAAARFAPALRQYIHGEWRGDVFVVARVGAAAGALMALGIAAIASEEASSIDVAWRWYLPLALALATLVAGLDASRRAVFETTAPFVTGVAATVLACLWSIDAPIEWYSVGLAATALAAAAAARFAPALRQYIHGEWRGDVFIVARAGTAAGALMALMIAGDGSGETPGTDIAWRWYLPIVLGMATLAAGVDASRKPMFETTAPFVTGIAATVMACLWSIEAPLAWYGAALVAYGIGAAMAGRTWQPSWIDGATRDGIAAGAVAMATVPFWAEYADDQARIGAGVHLAAAAFFGVAAVTDKSTRSLSAMLDLPGRIRTGIGWLYAAAFSAIIGYVFVLRSLPAADDADAGSLAVPMLAAAVAIAMLGALTKRLRPEFRMHLYAISLLTASAALATAPDAQMLSLLLGVLTATFAAISVYENEPLLGAPAVAFGAAAILTWHIAANPSDTVLPLAYSGVAAALYAGGYLLHRETRRWSDALRATGAVFALTAPVAGYALLSNETSGGLVAGAQWYESALYQTTIVAVALVGVLALAEASIAKRTWIIVPASATLLASLLLQIGRFNPDNVQPYAAAIGVYLVALGTFGLGRYRLMPQFASAATSIEALGAATILLPTFVQSFDPGWRYDALLIAEASAFLTAGIALRRRGVLTVSITFLVLSGGRALFDAVSAMPNWIVAMLAGIALLGIGVAILAGRERWDRWQHSVLTWWGETGSGPATP